MKALTARVLAVLGGFDVEEREELWEGFAVTELETFGDVELVAEGFAVTELETFGEDTANLDALVDETEVKPGLGEVAGLGLLILLDEAVESEELGVSTLEPRLEITKIITKRPIEMNAPKKINILTLDFDIRALR